MFAKVRGVPAELRPRIVQRTIQAMGLGLKADCRVGTYSGGNKRKLSVRDLQHDMVFIITSQYDGFQCILCMYTIVAREAASAPSIRSLNAY